MNAQAKQDLGFLGASISRLENQEDSVAEVVLQNWRSLNLLFMKQGGLCVALGEISCFYVNQSGIIRDTMAVVRSNIKI